ncbi:MAG: hypothetical protein ACXADX_13550 [Candidatus Hodarchaeales archaeon]
MPPPRPFQDIGASRSPAHFVVIKIQSRFFGIGPRPAAPMLPNFVITTIILRRSQNGARNLVSRRLRGRRIQWLRSSSIQGFWGRSVQRRRVPGRGNSFTRSGPSNRYNTRYSRVLDLMSSISGHRRGKKGTYRRDQKPRCKEQLEYFMIISCRQLAFPPLKRAVFLFFRESSVFLRIYDSVSILGRIKGGILAINSVKVRKDRKGFFSVKKAFSKVVQNLPEKTNCAFSGNSPIYNSSDTGWAASQ